MSVRVPHTHTRFVTRNQDFMDHVIEERRRLGLDRWDEVWDGEYHMSPEAGTEHQRLLGKLLLFLSSVVEAHAVGEVLGPLNVRQPGTGKSNYRVPDLVFVSKRRKAILSRFGCEGGPDLVVEIRSPDDESYEKLPFYAGQGVREAIVVEPETRRIELFRAARGKMVPVRPKADGTLLVRTLGATLRLTRRAGKPALEVRDTRDPARIAVI